MYTRKIALAIAIPAFLYPAISGASSERNSVKACASAFATSLSASGTSTPAYKLSYRGSGSALSDFYGAQYTFILEAHDPKTRLAIARVLCSTDSHGVVTSLSSLPLNSTKNAVLAAQ